jgi:transmembrane sensor
MTAGDDHNIELAPVMAEAIDWLVRLKSGTATTADARALADWRARSVDHDAAFREVVSYRQMTLGLPSARALPTPMVEAPRRRVMSRRLFLTSSGVAAASVAGALAARPPLGLWPSLAELFSDYRTAPGEHLAFTPSPGVTVEMNTRTSLSLADAGNTIHILDGETFVSVERRAAFSVSANGNSVSAEAARFNLRVIDDQFCATCVTGTVSVTNGAAQVSLQSGDQVIFVNGRTPQLRKIDTDTATAWRRGLLIFNGTSLADVIAEVNRYRPGRIILANEAIGDRPVNGVFHTAQIENTVAQIQQLLDVQLTHLPGGVVLMG